MCSSDLTVVRIRGANLGCPLAVSFGSKSARSFAPLGPCASADAAVEAVTPAGPARHKVPVTVLTWESYFTESEDAPSSALFKYR